MILDTNALSAFIDGNRAVSKQLNGLEHVSIPVIVLGEFRYGIAGSRHKALYEEWLDEHMPDFQILPVTASTAAVYSTIRVALKKSGSPIPANDAWIAAIALEHGLPATNMRRPPARTAV